jgi:hypothetical protein
MLEMNAGKLIADFNMVAGIGQTMRIIEAQRQEMALQRSAIVELRACAQGITDQCSNIGLLVSAGAARDLAGWVDKLLEFHKATTAEMLQIPPEIRGRIQAYATEVQTTLKREASTRNFLVIPALMVRLYEPDEPLFGADVEAKFANMSEDIAEAGKCLSLERPTAAVFHLMRVMELAVRRLGDELSVPLVDEKNWQVILDGVNKAIKSLDHKEQRTKDFASAASHLYAVKVAWRNEVMHPKQTYTQEQASAIFESAKVFVSELAGIL